VYGVHHQVEGRIEERLAGFGIKITDQLGIPFEVGKQHGHLLALAFQGAFGGEDLLSEIGWGVSEWGLSGGLHRCRGSCGSGTSVACPD
jgi:hypothetical protein